MDTLPTPFIFGFVFIFGLIIGSFLDVVVTRFNTGASINGRSRCLSCGHTLSWYELVPLLSYLILRGSCRSCKSHIPLRLLLVELTTASLFLWSVAVFGVTLFQIVLLPLLSILIAITLYDMKHMIIPHAFVYGLLVVAAVYLLWTYAMTGTYSFVLFHGIAAVLCSGFFGSLWLVSKGKWIGLGDAKLAFALGLFLSPLEAFSMVVFSFWIGAAVSCLLLLLWKIGAGGQRYLPFLRIPLTMKSEVPFAPFLIAAFLTVFIAEASVLTLLRNIYAF